MYIKQLIINGFKTFVDKTVINLSPGISVITGPNGVGKSNIYDAIRWVTGEQSKKALRAGKSEDVIFFGSDTRKAASFAEVTIVLADSVPVLNTDMTEVAISRRLYSTGESEYYINGVKVRLRDITHLFLDTGIGRDFYSFISQGSVANIIEYKPEARRQIFEEAAGIMKYRVNKEETLRKLERTRQDLQRISDVINEVENQMNFLRKQVRRAERYNKIKEKLVEIHRYILEQQFLRIYLQNEELTRDINRVDDKINEIQAEIDKNESRISGLKYELSKIDEENSEVTQKLSEIEREISRLEADINGGNEKISFYEAEEEKLLQKNRELVEKISQYRELNSRLESRIKENNIQLMQLGKLLKKKEKEYSDVESELTKFSSEVDNEQRIVLDIFEQLNALKSAINEEEQKLFYNEKSINDLKAQISFSRDKVTLLKREIENIRKSQEALEKQNNMLRAEKEKLLKQSAAIRENYNKLKMESEHISKEIYAKSQMLQNILELIKNLEGFSRGVKYVLQKKYPGVVDVVANLVNVAPKYELAIEVLLGNKLQNVVISEIDYAKKIIDDLKNSKEGRVTFIPLKNLKYKETERKREIEDMILGYAIDLVKMDEKYEPLKKYLFYNAVIVEDIEDAIKVSKKLEGNYHIVTLEGDIINPSNIVTGGYRRKEALGILNREGKARVLERELQKKKQEFEKYQNELQSLLLREQDIEETIADYQSKLEENGRVLSSYMERIRGYEEQLKEQEQFVSGREKELDSLSNEKAELQNRLSQLQEEYAAIEKEYESKKAHINDQKSRLISLQELMNKLRSELSALQEDKLNLNSQITTDKNAISQNESFIADAQQELESIKKNIENNRSLIRSLNLQIKQLQDDLKELIHNREQIERGRIDIVNKRNEIQHELDRIESVIKQKQKEKESLIEERNNFKIDARELEVKLAELQNEIRRNEGKTKVEEIEFIEDEELNNLIEKRARYEKSLQNIGPVNPSIIDEYNQVKERYEFLIKQKEDIENSREALLKIIREINKKIRVLFTTSFEEIRNNFKINFTRFFGGGEADLVLVGDEDILEAGIEIYARLPGEKMKTISLLSGGEKALTALALVFAIFMKKPSPFCVLDEIDAALDDVNGKKLVEILKEFKKETQFIIISHKKTTIAAADVIYGVTMEERGVSKVISVRFKAAQAAG